MKLPAPWEWPRLDDLCEISMGQAPPGEAYNSEGRGWPLIAGAGDFDGTRPAATKFTKRATRLSQPRDVVLGIRASIGEKVIADRVYCLGRGVAGLRAGPDVDDRFLWHWLTHARPALASKAKGATFKQVNREDIGGLVVLLPPLSEQRRIADIVDRADALRAKRRAALAQLDTLTQSIFLDMFGDPNVGPLRWPIVRFADLLSIPLRNGLSPSHGGSVLAKVLTLSAITDNAFDAAAVKLSTFQSSPPETQRVDKRDFLICRGNGNLGLVGRGRFPSQSMSDITFPDTVIAGRPNVEKMAPAYLEQVWNSAAVRRQVERLARTTNGTFKVNQAMLEGVVVPVPPKDLQERFAVRVSATGALRAECYSSLAELDALFVSLQHRAFRGAL